jgi:hypothetical protein
LVGSRGVCEHSREAARKTRSEIQERITGKAWEDWNDALEGLQHNAKTLHGVSKQMKQGNVFQKGRKKTDCWLPGVPCCVRFWRDIPGQAKLKREKVPLGICRTRTIAERKAAEKLELLGINSTQTFIETTSNIRFRTQGEIWLKSLSNRKRNPLEATTITNRRYALHKWIYPFFADTLLADVNNRAMKELLRRWLQSFPLHPSAIT